MALRTDSEPYRKPTAMCHWTTSVCTWAQACRQVCTLYFRHSAKAYRALNVGKPTPQQRSLQCPTKPYLPLAPAGTRAPVVPAANVVQTTHSPTQTLLTHQLIHSSHSPLTTHHSPSPATEQSPPSVVSHHSPLIRTLSTALFMYLGIYVRLYVCKHVSTPYVSM